MPPKAEKKDLPEEEVEESSEDESTEDESESEEEDTTLNNTDVVEKYKIAAKFCNQTLDTVLAEIKVGKSVAELCDLGDTTINQLVGTVFNKKKGEDAKKVDRGVAFPTCVNVNGIVSHFAATSDEKLVLADGDVVRVDLGVHIDGYPVVVAHTVVVQAEEKPLTGKQADAFAAAQQCIDVAVKALRPGGSNQNVTELWNDIAEAYGVNLVEGVLSHQLKRYVIDSNDVIISKSSIEQKVEDYEFEAASAWSIDVLVSTGPGKLKEGDARPFVYKRAPDQQYLLKTQAGRVVLNEINTKFQQFPFTVRALESRGARLGVSEALKHDLLVAYPVLHEKTGETVVHLKATVLITNAAIQKVTGKTVSQKFETDKKVESDKVKAALALGLNLKTNKKKKNKKKKDAAAAAAPAK